MDGEKIDDPDRNDLVRYIHHLSHHSRLKTIKKWEFAGLQKRPGIHMLDLDAERTAGKAPRGAPIDLVSDGRSPGVFLA